MLVENAQGQGVRKKILILHSPIDDVRQSAYCIDGSESAVERFVSGKNTITHKKPMYQTLPNETTAERVENYFMTANEMRIDISHLQRGSNINLVVNDNISTIAEGGAFVYGQNNFAAYLSGTDAPVEMKQTQEFWEILKTGKYDVFLSEVTTTELMRCSEPKLSELLALLDEIRYTVIEVQGNAEIPALEIEIRNMAILPPKSENDRLHIAVALHSGCNIIVSWNFKHLVTEKTIDGVRMVCVANHISPVDIYSPVVLLERSVPNE